VFLVDVEGHRTDAALANALKAARTRTDFVKVFGSYPRSK
jgi:prephenate dehydratase